MQPGVLDSCRRALGCLEAIGCRVEPVSARALGVPLPALWECWLVLRTVAAAPALFEHLRKARELMKPEAIWEAERGLAMSAEEVARASQVRTRFYQSWLRLFERHDFLVLPSAQVFPFDAAIHWPAEVGGRRMDTYHRWMEVVTYATLSGSPAISMPVPLADPTKAPAPGDLAGIQIIGAPRDDLGVLPTRRGLRGRVGGVIRKAPLGRARDAPAGLRRHQPVHPHHLEVRTLHLAQLGLERGVVPARVGRAADVPVGAVVREDHAVGLQRVQIARVGALNVAGMS